MTEEKNNALPEANGDKSAVTMPREEKKIPIKFNKQTIEVTLERTTELAQKGMKYELISKDYETLRNLATKENKSVGEFLELLNKKRLEERLSVLNEKCTDNDLAKHILRLEEAENKIFDSGLSELMEFFPEIKTEEQLPFEVLEKSRLTGTRLLDEYLRYLLKEKSAKEKALDKSFKVNKKSLGSMQNKNGGADLEAIEFLKGLWRKE